MYCIHYNTVNVFNFVFYRYIINLLKTKIQLVIMLVIT